MLNTIDIYSIFKPNLLDNSIYEKITARLNYAAYVLRNAENVSSFEIIPVHFKKNIDDYISDYNGIILRFQDLMNSRNDDQLFSNIQIISQQADTLYAALTDISSSAKFLPAYNSSISLILGEFQRKIKNLDTEILDSILEKAKTQSEKSEEYLTNIKSKIDFFYEDIQKKAANLIVSDYAKIFEAEEEKYRKSSKNWLITAVGFTFLTLLFLILSFSNDWFHITTSVNHTSNSGISESKDQLNFVGLLSKLLIVSLLLYLISFFFKQYSINKHLKTVNNHRKNALNSYNNFALSLGTSDHISKNALMLEVAKSIYDLGNTGYLSTKKSDNPTNGLIGLTNYITPPKV